MMMVEDLLARMRFEEPCVLVEFAADAGEQVRSSLIAEFGAAINTATNNGSGGGKALGEHAREFKVGIEAGREFIE
jgi:hypothetical protein